MPRKDLAEIECSIARTLEAIGERWSLLILRDAFYGVRRFDDFQKDLDVPKSVLATRLAKLVEHGILERRQYEEHPARFEYRLTAKGRDLFPVVVSLMHWGDTWAADEGAPTTLVHNECAHHTHVVAACAHCNGELTPFNVIVDPLPDYIAELAAEGRIGRAREKAAG